MMLGTNSPFEDEINVHKRHPRQFSRHQALKRVKKKEINK